MTSNYEIEESKDEYAGLHYISESNNQFYYDETEKLGSGYSAEVYACNRASKRTVSSPAIEHYAVKVFHTTQEEGRLNAAKLEAGLLSKFSHENIIKFQALFLGFNNLQAYLNMERVSDAQPLHKFIKKRG